MCYARLETLEFPAFLCYELLDFPLFLALSKHLLRQTIVNNLAMLLLT